MDTIHDNAYFCKKNDIHNSIRLFYIVFKRIFDIVMSLLGFTMLLPAFFIISIFIKLGSPGSVFFKQNRIGLNGKKFVMYKFRTMVIHSEAQLAALKSKNVMKGNVFKIKDDPRVTKIGRILRKTSIDELPQLLNVLKGDMSLVGPRPPLDREYILYEGWHTLRLVVKPGMTGLWQINGRNSVSFDDMLRLDFKYIRQRSFFFDLKIVLKTIPLLLGDENAF